MRIDYQETTDAVDWFALKAALARDRFDNGRTAQEYRISHERAHAVVLAVADGEYVGNGRVLSDGVCNAYLVDIWAASALRRRGIGSAIVRRLLATVPGQHVALLTDDRADFYATLGFVVQHEAMSLVHGTWLNRT